MRKTRVSRGTRRVEEGGGEERLQKLTIIGFLLSPPCFWSRKRILLRISVPCAFKIDSTARMNSNPEKAAVGLIRGGGVTFCFASACAARVYKLTLT